MKKALLTALALLAFAAPSAALADDLVIATGSESGTYEQLGVEIGKQINSVGKKKKVEFDVEILNTTGSGENIDLFNEGEANIIIVQADALNVVPPTASFKSKTLHRETVWWLYNTKNNIDDLDEMPGSKAKMVVIDGSGAIYTMRNFAQEDSDYQEPLDKAIRADDLEDAFDLVCEGKFGQNKVAGLLYVGGSLPKEIREDYSGCVSVGEATDSDFNDSKDINGDKLYENCEIASALYSPLKGSSSFGKEDTVCVRAMAVFSTDFEDKAEFKVVRKGINKVASKYR